MLILGQNKGKPAEWQQEIARQRWMKYPKIGKQKMDNLKRTVHFYNGDSCRF